MPLDHDKLRAILNKDLSYYGAHDAAIRKDGRLGIFPGDLLARYCQPGMRVLDLGCGRGWTLLENRQRFKAGIGVDNDPEHIQLAQAARREMGAENVEFFLMEFPKETEQLGIESFDIVLSNLGPMGDSPASIQASLALLKPDGLILCSEIGELHQPEANELFGRPPHGNQHIHVAERLRTWMVECGVEIRLSADVVSKWYYPDIYAWFLYQCNVWTWLGVPLPAPDDPRLELFAERNTTLSGEIETTHHVAVVAGIKTNAGVKR